MNKVVTDGIALMPLPFSAGLDRWSSRDGQPGDPHYAENDDAELITDDADFETCLSLHKSQAQMKLRAMAETPIMPGCYLRISARIKVADGPCPTVRIAGWPGLPGKGGAEESTTQGPVLTPNALGDVYEISAIVGTADRTGVDIVWRDAIYGHFGLDFGGKTGGRILIDDLKIEDVTEIFIADLIAAVDVRDFGAVPDGQTDCTAAFQAADLAAQGRTVVVPHGVYRISDNLIMRSEVRFNGHLTQSANRFVLLTHRFGYVQYLAAFGDPETAFRKAFQAMNYSDMLETLDMGGKEVLLTAPMTMQQTDPDYRVSNTRRYVSNGVFRVEANDNWDVIEHKTQATYDSQDAWLLRGVQDIERIPVGALVEGDGVGKEVYVTEVNTTEKSLQLSQPFYAVEGTQEFKFRRFQYALDFSGFDSLENFGLHNVTLQCEGIASGVLLAGYGRNFTIKDCRIMTPADRAVTSFGTGCAGLRITGCQIQGPALVKPHHYSLAFNANANEVRLRDNNVSSFTVFGVMAGAGGLASGNLFSRGHQASKRWTDGALILTKPLCATVIAGNSFVNGAVVWATEHLRSYDRASEPVMGGLTVTGNNFSTSILSHAVRFISIRPCGPNHRIDGLNIVGNIFRSLNGRINRVEKIDSTIATIAHNQIRGVTMTANTFQGVRDVVMNPATLVHTQKGAAKSWIAQTAPVLPFGGAAVFVDSIVPIGAIQTGQGNDVFDLPHVHAGEGEGKSLVRFVWSKSVEGKVRFQVRMDAAHR